MPPATGLQTPILVDFHCHSTHSDGAFPPEELAGRLYRAGVQYAALTDHDSTEGLESFQQSVSAYGIGFIAGVEITTLHRGVSIHLLAYGFDRFDKPLQAILTETKGFKDPATDMISPSRVPTIDVIRIVHRAGGIAVMAHPLKTEPSVPALAAIAGELAAGGLDGLEAVYVPNSPEDDKTLLDLAGRHHLVSSAGSDFHTAENAIGIGFDSGLWKPFRDAVLAAAAQQGVARSPASPGRNPNKRARYPGFFPSIILPALLALGLFIFALFGLLSPYFEQSLFERKRESIRDLTKAALGVLQEAATEVKTNQMPLEKAQELAKRRIEAMRYGRDGKEYFWLQDLSPTILMHPYRPDLVDQNVSDFKDAGNIRIFVEFVRVALEKREGFVSYVWQWNDDPERLEAKESYVKLFEEWNWIIGTGIYDKEVQEDIEKLRNHFLVVSLVIVSIILLILVFLVKNGLSLEKARQKSEGLLHESIDRYRALSEAATEGVLLLTKSRCRHANAMMYELLGCDESRLQLLELDDIFPALEANEEWLAVLAHTDLQDRLSGIPGIPGVPGILKRCDGTLINCVLTLKSGSDSTGGDIMVLVRRSIDDADIAEKKLDLKNLLQLPTTVSSDVTEAIAKARQVDDLVAICGQTRELVRSLLENAASAIEITRMLSTITDAAVKKLVDIAVSNLGPPPSGFVFLALGSHGRESQTLYSDQDNAIIYMADERSDGQDAQTYFLKLADQVCGGLELTGYRKCDGQKMANNPLWCQPVDAWKSYFKKWIEDSNPQDVLEFSVFFDIRGVAGAIEIADDMRNHVSALLTRNPQFLVQLARNALGYSPPIRLFGNIMSYGGKAHPDLLDVKAPNLAIAGFARLYALKMNISETNTIARLAAITRAGILQDSTHRNIVTTFEALSRLRLWNQVLSLQKNQELGNWLNPDHLGHIEEVILIECFNEIEMLQSRIQRDFFGGAQIV